MDRELAKIMDNVCVNKALRVQIAQNKLYNLCHHSVRNLILMEHNGFTSNLSKVYTQTRDTNSHFHLNNLLIYIFLQGLIVIQTNSNMIWLLKIKII